MLKENQDSFAQDAVTSSATAASPKARGSTVPEEWHSERASVLHTAKTLDPILQDAAPMRQKMYCFSASTWRIASY